MQIDVDIQFLRDRYADHARRVRGAQDSYIHAIQNEKQQGVQRSRNAWARYTTAQDRKAEFIELMVRMGLLSSILEEEVADAHTD